MIFRLIAILILLVFFINSCNSLISVLAGTHKLRTFDMERVAATGVGDADYIEITDAWLSTDFVYSPRESPKGTGIIEYPVLTAGQYEQLQRGEPVVVHLIGWTEMKDTACVANGKCFDPGRQPLRGMLRPVNPRRDVTADLPAQRYRLTGRPLFLEVGISPQPWYWHLAVMVFVVLGALLIEWQFGSLKKTKK